MFLKKLKQLQKGESYVVLNMFNTSYIMLKTFFNTEKLYCIYSKSKINFHEYYAIWKP